MALTIEFGQKYRDRITGFEGMATGRTSYITGCEQILVQPRVKDDGTYQDPHWFDIGRLEALEGAVQVLNKPGEVIAEAIPLIDQTAPDGFDIPAPVR